MLSLLEAFIDAPSFIQGNYVWVYTHAHTYTNSCKYIMANKSEDMRNIFFWLIINFWLLLSLIWGFPGGSAVKNLPANEGDAVDPWVGKIPSKRKWRPITVFLPTEFHGQGSLVGYSPCQTWVRHDWSNLAHLVHTHLQSENGKVISFQDFPNHVSFSTGESIHWSRKPSPTSDASPWSQPEAVDVELTAYVLLTLLSKDDLTQKELSKATGIVAWLTKQRNAYGGFSSTQVNSLFFCHLSGRIGSHMERDEKRSPLPSRSGD